MLIAQSYSHFPILVALSKSTPEMRTNGPEGALYLQLGHHSRPPRCRVARITCMRAINLLLELCLTLLSSIAECNNALIYPGLGLGAIVSQSRTMSDTMLLAGTQALASLAPALKNPDEALLPDFQGMKPYLATTACSNHHALQMRNAQTLKWPLRSQSKRLRKDRRGSNGRRTKCVRGLKLNNGSRFMERTSMTLRVRFRLL